MDMIIYYSGADSSYGQASDDVIDDLSVMMTYGKIGRDEESQSYRFWKLLEKRARQNKEKQSERKA